MSSSSVFLHTCCAPCSTSCIERLQNDFQVAAYFYNPNIYPKEEYFFRQEEMKKYAGPVGVPFYSGEFASEHWYQLVKGKESVSEKSRIRCSLCIYDRLWKTADQALKEGYDCFTTTLSVSPHKDAGMINRMGRNIEKKLGIRYLSADFKKKDGYKRSIELSKSFNMYRQNYCGCEFSLK